MPTGDGYPTERELEYVRNWDTTKSSILDFIEELRRLWWADDWGFKCVQPKSNALELELHTGGWSGNEDIIGALKGTMFWLLYWQMSRRGGHYYFGIESVIAPHPAEGSMNELRETVIQEVWEAMRWARQCSDHVWECEEHNQPKRYTNRILHLVAEAVEGMPLVTDDELGKIIDDYHDDIKVYRAESSIAYASIKAERANIVALFKGKEG